MTHERTLFLLSLIIQVLSASSGDSVSLPSLGTLTKVGGQKKTLESQVGSGTDSSSVSHENLDCRVCLSKKIEVIFFQMRTHVLLRKLCSEDEWVLSCMPLTRG